MVVTAALAEVWMFPPCRIAVFSVTVLRDERIVVVAEQRPDSTEEDSFQWMSRVLQVLVLEIYPRHVAVLFDSIASYYTLLSLVFVSDKAASLCSQVLPW